VGTTASTLTSGTTCFFDFLLSSVFSAVDHTVKGVRQSVTAEKQGNVTPTLSEVLLIHVRHKPNCISPTTITIVFLRIGRNEIQVALDFFSARIETVMQLGFDFLQVHGSFDYRVIPKENDIRKRQWDEI
jgi:hypothetical protein